MVTSVSAFANVKIAIVSGVSIRLSEWDWSRGQAPELPGKIEPRVAEVRNPEESIIFAEAEAEATVGWIQPRRRSSGPDPVKAPENAVKPTK